jgi:hypothetical protein
MPVMSSIMLSSACTKGKKLWNRLSEIVQLPFTESMILQPETRIYFNPKQLNPAASVDQPHKSGSSHS